MTEVWPPTKVSFDSVKTDNQALAAEIEAYVRRQSIETTPIGKHEDTTAEEALKELLKQLYQRVCNFCVLLGRASTPDRKIIATWHSFLDPIRSLTNVTPHGHMLAARMVLYLTSAFLQNKQLSSKFASSTSKTSPEVLRDGLLVALDDTLLSNLTVLWDQGRKRETFDWVFSAYPVRASLSCSEGVPEKVMDDPDPSAIRESMAQDTIKRTYTACLTKPSELTPANGVHSGRFWRRPDGDTHDYSIHPEASQYMFDDNEKDKPLLMWQMIGSDGPIRDDYHYQLINEDTGKGDWRGRPALRRSRQFVLDTRKISARYLFRDRFCIATIILARCPLPVELQTEVLGYLKEEQPPKHPYLSKLDLSAIYEPFPDITRPECDYCVKADYRPGRNYATTCPLHAFTVWNLPLRTFHTFHRLSADRWWLCGYEICTGHHENGKWRVRDLEGYLNGILNIRCGPDTTLQSIGFGPLDPMTLPTEDEDKARMESLFSFQGDGSPEHDAVGEAKWIGLKGLAEVMNNGVTFVGLHTHGRATTAPSWLCGRTRRQEARVYFSLSGRNV